MLEAMVTCIYLWDKSVFDQAEPDREYAQHILEMEYGELMDGFSLHINDIGDVYCWHVIHEEYGDKEKEQDL